MATYAWGEYGQQGAERQQQRETLAKEQQRRAQEAAEWQRRIPAWQDGVRQVQALLVGARARQEAAKAETARAFDALEEACFYRQRGECATTPEGQRVMDNRHPAVARQNDAWVEAQEAEKKAAGRVQNLEAEKAYYEALIATARMMT